MSKQFVQAFDGEWVRVRNRRRYRIACCDCGLVHDMEFRVRDGKIELRAWRNPQATGGKRCHFGAIRLKVITGKCR